MRNPLVRSLLALALVAPAGPARADLLDDVQKQIAPVRARRLGEVAARTREAELIQQRQLAELARAEALVKDAQAKMAKVAEEARRAREKAEELARRIAEQGKQKVGVVQKVVDQRAAEQAQRKARAAEAAEEVKRTRERAAAATEAARALEAAVVAISAGRTDVDPDVERARQDAELKLAADAVAGMAAHLRGEDRKALELLTPAVLMKLPAARRYLGLAKRRLGDRDGALAELQQARLAPADTEAQRALAELAEASGDHATAGRAWATVFAANPIDQSAGMGLARALLGQGKPADALTPLAALIADPANQDAAYFYGFAAERAGDGRRAEMAWAQLVGREAGSGSMQPSYTRRNRPLRVLPMLPPWTAVPDKPDPAVARLRYAWYRLGRGDDVGARRALEGLEGRADGRYLRGLADLQGWRLQSARTELEAAAKLDPARPEPTIALAVALLEQGDAAGAGRTVASLAGQPGADLVTAMALAAQGKPAEAEPLLTRHLKAPGSLGDTAATDLGALRRNAGATDAALQVMPERPLTPEGWLLLGYLLGDKRDDKRAEAALRAAVEAAPNYLDAWMALAALIEKARPAAAREAAEHALEISPDCVEAHALLARVYGREGDSKRQSAELARIREIGEQASGAAPRHSIAVVAFENNTGDKSLDWMRQGVAEALVGDLSRLGSLTIIERTQVQKGFQEQKLQELGLAEPGALARVGKVIGADAILVGAFSKAGDEIRLDGRVVEVGTNQILKTGSASGKTADLFQVERKLALDLVSEYAAVTSREKVDFFAAKQPSVDSLQTMSRIRMLSAEGKAQEAREAYERLLNEDPKAAEKLKELQKGWAEVAATVAVVPLQNVSARPEDTWLGVGLAEALTTDLKKVGLFLVERGQIEKLMQERRLTEIFNAEQAQSLGKLAGATILLMGSYQAVGTGLRVDARLVDVATAQVMQSYTVEGKKEDVFEVEGRLVKEMAAALKVEPTKMEKAALASARPSLDDFKRYIQSTSKLALREGPARPAVVKVLAMAPVKDARGQDDRTATDLLRAALQRNAMVEVRDATSPEPEKAGADALILASFTPGDSAGKTRIDTRAVFPSGEIAASATAMGDAKAAGEQAARNLLAGLALQRPPTEESGGKPVYKKWWLWTLVGVAAAGGATTGLVLGLGGQSPPAADATITVPLTMPWGR